MMKMKHVCERHANDKRPARPSLTEEIILNYDALPDTMRNWRRFRIEYGYECGCPEGTIYLPPTENIMHVVDSIETMLRLGDG